MGKQNPPLEPWDLAKWERFILGIRSIGRDIDRLIFGTPRVVGLQINAFADPLMRATDRLADARVEFLFAVERRFKGRPLGYLDQDPLPPVSREVSPFIERHARKNLSTEEWTELLHALEKIVAGIELHISDASGQGVDLRKALKGLLLASRIVKGVIPRVEALRASSVRGAEGPE